MDELIISSIITAVFSPYIYKCISIDMH